MKKITIILAIMIVKLVVVSFAMAGDAKENKVGLFGNLGYTVYNEGWEYTSDDCPKPFKGDFLYSGGILYNITKSFQMGLEVGQIRAGDSGETEYSLLLGYDKKTSKPVYANVEKSLEMKLPALEMGLMGRYLFELTNSFYLTTGVGINYIKVNGSSTYKEKITAANVLVMREADIDITGSGIGIKGLLGAQYFLSKNVSIGAEIGYRQAEIEVDMKNKLNDKTAKSKLDYSGIISQANITLYL